MESSEILSAALHQLESVLAESRMDSIHCSAGSSSVESGVSSSRPANNRKTAQQDVTAVVQVLLSMVGNCEDEVSIFHGLPIESRGQLQHWIQTANCGELANQNALETHKLDLMVEISQLKLRLATSEREKRELAKKVEELDGRLSERLLELAQQRSRHFQPLSRSNSLTRNGSLPSSPVSGNGSGDHSDIFNRTLEREKTLDRLKRQHVEVERLKQAVDALASSNDEKDKQLEKLTLLLKSYCNKDDVDLSFIKNQPIDESAGKVPADERPVDASRSTLPAGQGPDRSNPSEGFGDMNVKPLSKTLPGGRHHRVGHAQSDANALKDSLAREYKAMQGSPTSLMRKKSSAGGLRKFFGILRRTNSQDLDVHTEEFKRNGLRATAGPRLGWARDIINKDLPFDQWTVEQITAWLHSMGLSMYINDCKRWLKSGRMLLETSANELEKEMNVKNHFHRKKILLALKSVNNADPKNGDHLDHLWVTRWLDDIGLPQYKDQFLDARLDGRMLNHLTVDELVSLRVHNTLHHLSIKRSIHVLRLHGFNPHCLQRRPVPDQQNEQVWLWTNHRVMEWLRTIDLSEYAPNLRGSGVHGAIMVLEPRFGADVFASILSIPSSKTLLRRHLSTHFVSLVGPQMQSKKRELEGQPNFVLLTPNQKVKLKKLRLFSRHYSDSVKEDYLCPNDSSGAADFFLPDMQNHSKSNSLTSKNEASEKNEDEEISTLTDMLAQDELLDQMPTSNV